MQIRITQTTTPKQKPDQSQLGFGKYYTDHMFVMPYSADRGWYDPAIVPFAPFSLSPATMVFHYAQECFEGLKAYRTAEGRIQLFRPEKNAQRMAATHQRLCIPEVPEDIFVQAVKELVKIDNSWVPTLPDASLYIRPCTIATDAHLGVRVSNNYLFFIVMSPSGAYYSAGLNPVKIFVEDEYTRAAPGGTGAVKCGGNYAASLLGQKKAEELGYNQVLWLDGVHRKFIEEVGSMNCFFKIGGEVYTAPLNGTVLPGITRMSCIELMKDWGYTVKEEPISIDYLLACHKEGRLEEVFGTGTAAVITSVGEMRYKEETIVINNGQTGALTSRLYDTLTGIQWGRVPDTKNWIQQI